MLTKIYDFLLSRKFTLRLQSRLVRKLNPIAIFGEWWINPMGGQARRIKKVIELCDEFQPSLVIETGTFVGSTSPLLANLFSSPVITIELNPRLASRNKMMFEYLYPGLNISQVTGNSDTELTRILEQRDLNEKIFAYLDAHWFDYLPTTNELKALVEWGGDFIALVDDFKNDLHPGYGWDQYTSGTFIGKHLLPKGAGLRLFVPSLDPEKEGLARRGTAYIFSNNVFSKFPNLNLNQLIELEFE
jgi:hypothetical protein